MISWNYRIGTRWVVPEGSKDPQEDGERIFSVIECHYGADQVPTHWMECDPLKNWASVEDLQETYQLLQIAFQHAPLDLDNFPDPFQE